MHAIDTAVPVRDSAKVKVENCYLWIGESGGKPVRATIKVLMRTPEWFRAKIIAIHDQSGTEFQAGWETNSIPFTELYHHCSLSQAVNAANMATSEAGLTPPALAYYQAKQRDITDWNAMRAAIMMGAYDDHPY